MKRTLWAGFAGCACMLLSLAMAGCEWLDVPSSATTGDITGTWTYLDTAGAQLRLVLIQEDDDSIVGVGAQSGTNNVSISGYVSTDSVYMTLTHSNESIVDLSGVIAGDVMSGSFTNSASTNGTWTAVKIN